MSRQPNQKSKILFLRDILERTDEDHPVSMSRILQLLSQNGIEAERKSIYSDIEVLQQYGMDIQLKMGKGGGYYSTDRRFELPELKLLVDAVQYSRFISQKKSDDLIHKLIGLAKASEEKSLNRQIIGYARTKSRNEMLYYSIDAIHDAITGNHQIRFQYYQWNLKKEQELRHGGAFYQVSPWALIWDDENYYLIAYDEAAGICKNYRVDKMLHISVTEKPRLGREVFDRMNIAAYTERTFSMFSGEETNVTLRCDNSMIGVILDRFGTDIFVIPAGPDHFDVNVRVAVSGPFFGWIFGLGGKVRIQSPASVRREMQTWAERFI